MKPCKHCGGEQTPKPSGKGYRCNPCHAAYMAEYHAKKTTRKTARRHGWCVTCGQEKPVGTKHPRCALQREAEKRAKKAAERPSTIGVCRKCGGPSSRKEPCKPCRNAYLRVWNREHGITGNGGVGGNPTGGRPRIIDEFTDKPLTAKQRYMLRHPEAIKAQRAAYKQRPEVKMASRLRANLSRAWTGGGYGAGIIEVTEHDVRRMIDRQHGMCAICARTDRPLTIDHIQPISRGGTNALTNLQCLCRPCNTSKMTRTFSGIGYLLALQGLTPSGRIVYEERRSKRAPRKRQHAEPTNLALHG